MTTSVLNAPRRRVAVKSVDMNAHLEEACELADAAVRLYLSSTGKQRKQWYFDVLDTFAGYRPMFGLQPNRTKMCDVFIPGKDASNLKIGKNGIPTVSLTLSSHTSCRIPMDDGTLLVLNTCRHAGLCAGVCVLSHGRGSFSTVKAARAWRTYCLYRHPEAFAVALAHEITSAVRVNGKALGRLNVNADLNWELVPSLFVDGFYAYDYTKDPTVLDGEGWALVNYRKVYSFNERSDCDDVRDFLARGGSVAMVTNRVKGQSACANVAVGGWSFGVVDGDVSDNRFDDPAGVVVDLYAKGKARNRKSAFVQSIY